MTELVYPELSYQLIGIMFDVYNELGGGLKEKHYEKAVKKLFDERSIHYSEQLMVPIIFKSEQIGKNFLDFLVERKIVIELKTGERFKKENINQIYNYLKSSNLKLGILVNFRDKDVRFKRILNI